MSPRRNGTISGIETGRRLARFCTRYPSPALKRKSFMSARDAQPKALRLRDYRAPDYPIDRTHLRVDIGSETTQVSAQLNLRRNPAAAAPVAELALNGVDIRLISVAIDGGALAEHEYRLDSE